MIKEGDIMGAEVNLPYYESERCVPNPLETLVGQSRSRRGYERSVILAVLAASKGVPNQRAHSRSEKAGLDKSSIKTSY